MADDRTPAALIGFVWFVIGGIVVMAVGGGIEDIRQPYKQIDNLQQELHDLKVDAVENGWAKWKISKDGQITMQWQDKPERVKPPPRLSPPGICPPVCPTCPPLIRDGG